MTKLIFVLLLILSGCTATHYCTYDLYQGGIKIDTVTCLESRGCSTNYITQRGIYYKLIKSEKINVN